MAEEKEEKCKESLEVTEFTKAVAAPIETVLNRRAEIIQLDFRELEKIGYLLEKSAIAALNVCCNGSA